MMVDRLAEDRFHRGQVDDALHVVLEAIAAVKIAVQGNLNLAYDRRKQFSFGRIDGKVFRRIY